MTQPCRFLLVLVLSAAHWAVPVLRAQSFAIYDSLPQLEARIKSAGDTTLVINFWATWCKPCVEELPCFDELRVQYAAQNVQVLLVSLDFKSQIEKKFTPFLREQNITSEVVLMADQDFNTWMPRIHEDWDGAIPATLVMQGKKRRLNIGKFNSLEELEAFVRPFVTDTSALFIVEPMPSTENGGRK